MKPSTPPLPAACAMPPGISGMYVEINPETDAVLMIDVAPGSGRRRCGMACLQGRNTPSSSLRRVARQCSSGISWTIPM